jgi:hypothetical protein
MEGMARRAWPAAVVGEPVTGPRIYFRPDTSAEEREAAARTIRATMTLALVDFQYDGVTVSEQYWATSAMDCSSCGTRTRVWASSVARRMFGERLPEVVQVAFPCPLCHPDPTELDKAGRIVLARALARTDALDTLHVLLDQALNEGRTSEQQWHNPDDLAEIAALKSLLEERFPATKVWDTSATGWSPTHPPRSR